jgi:radical SAM protein with 4Fe4S-binding SPASM domain
MKYDKLNSYIYTSNRCNLKCTYCYVDGEIEVINTKENIDKYLDILFISPYTKDREEIKLNFIGGEPLVELDLIEYTIEQFFHKAKQYNHHWLNNFTFMISTNGTLVNTEMVKNLLEKYPFFVGFSLDGPENIHDKNRMYKNDCGSFNDVISNFKWIQEKYNIDRADSTLSNNNVGELYDILSFQLNTLKTRAIGVNVNGSAYFSKDDARNVKSQVSRIIDDLIVDNKEFTVAIKNLLKPLNYYDHDEKNNYKDLFKCSFARYTICIHPSGDIYPCQILASNNINKFAIGHVDTGLDMDKINANLEKIKSAKCNKCRFNSICRKCFAQIYNPKNDTFDKMYNNCNLTKIGIILTHIFINKLKENIKNTIKFI